jgi:Ca2+-transporting ATPase
MVDNFALGEGWAPKSWKTLVHALVKGITIAVVTVPESLPFIVTTFLAHSVGRMARRGVVAGNLQACELLG